MSPVTAGRADLDAMAQRLMASLRARAKEPGPPPVREGVDTLYYSRTSVVQANGQWHWIVHVHRGMAERVGEFEVQVRPGRVSFETRLVRRYAQLLEEHGYSNEEARRRAGACKLEQLSEEGVSLLATGKVTL